MSSLQQRVEELEQRVLYLENNATFMSRYRVGMTVTGAVNGINDIFIVSENFKMNSLSVIKDGIFLTRDVHFLELDNNRFQLLTAPGIGSVLRVNYVTEV